MAEYRHPYGNSANQGSSRGLMDFGTLGPRLSTSWFLPTYQVNTANVSVQPPMYRPQYAPPTQEFHHSTAITENQSENVHVSDFSIKVVNPVRKRDAKTYVLKDMQPQSVRSLKCLKEEILEQLGKRVVSFQLDFDVGYMSGNQRICFSEKDEIPSQLLKLSKGSCQLWCEGISPQSVKRKRCISSPILVDDSSNSEDDVQPSKKKPAPKKTALDDKAERVQKLADKLQGIHGDTYNKIQYKLWAEAMDVKKHVSMERPPPGTIWGAPKEKKRQPTDAINEAFTSMASSIASAFSKPAPCNSPNKSTPMIQPETGVSPGRLADLQGKFFSQIEQLHKLYECGALSEDQFEKRKQVILERLDELASK